MSQKFYVVRRSVAEILCGAAKFRGNLMRCGEVSRKFDEVRRSVSEI